MAIPDLSSIIKPETVIAQLGVNSTDISSDTVKATGAYEELFLDYGDWFPNFMDLINSTDQDQATQRQQIAIKAYGKFFVCRKVILSAPMSFFQKFGDGANDDRRFNVDFDEMKANFEEEMARMKAAALAIDTPQTPVKEQATGYSVFGVAPPSFDNVRQ